MKLSKKLLDQSGEMLKDLLNHHANEINEAFAENDEILEVSVKMRYSFIKEKFKIQTGINFVADRVKDDSTFWYDPKQRQLFKEDPDAGSGDDR